MLNIWQTNDRVEWSDIAFEVIQELLLDRLGEVPPQNPPITKQVETPQIPFEPIKPNNSFPVSKPLRISGILFFIILTPYILSYSIIASKNNWKISPFVENLLLLGLGICLSIIGFTYTYFAWKLSSNEYVNWDQSQYIFRFKSIQNKIMSSVPWYYHWVNRLGSPLIIIAGMILIGAALFLTFDLLLK